jgi:hypothetical protein
MKKITLITASLLLVGSSALALAGSKSQGASSSSPGQQMREQTNPTTKGAAEFTPADQMKDAGSTTKGASEFTPPDKKNDAKKK